MIKSFDCVEMKHKAGRKISAKLSKMSATQQLGYWREKHKALVDLQEKAIKQKSSRVKSLNK